MKRLTASILSILILLSLASCISAPRGERKAVPKATLLPSGELLEYGIDPSTDLQDLAALELDRSFGLTISRIEPNQLVLPSAKAKNFSVIHIEPGERTIRLYFNFADKHHRSLSGMDDKKFIFEPGKRYRISMNADVDTMRYRISIEEMPG